MFTIFSRSSRQVSQKNGLIKLAFSHEMLSSLPKTKIRCFATLPERFRTAFDYAESKGYLGGYPNFHKKDYGDEQGIVFGTLLHKNGVEWRNIPTEKLDNMDSDQDKFRSVYSYARKNGFVGGYPNFHKKDYDDGRGVVHGAILIRRDVAEWRDIPARELGDPLNEEERFRAIQNYAKDKKFISGFPNFYKKDYHDGRGVCYGAVLIKSGTESESVSTYILDMYTNYGFDNNITRSQRLKVLSQHARGFLQAIQCGNLIAQERLDLLDKYKQSITHGINNDPNANASGRPNGTHIDVNFNVLFPQGDDEIAQSLIHEMMHCAGYGHPDRIDTGPNRDVPYNNGPYYGSPPLRAEMCIAGRQSLTGEKEMRTCEEKDGVYSIRRLTK